MTNKQLEIFNMLLQKIKEVNEIVENFNCKDFEILNLKIGRENSIHLYYDENDLKEFNQLKKLYNTKEEKRRKIGENSIYVSIDIEGTEVGTFIEGE